MQDDDLDGSPRSCLRALAAAAAPCDPDLPFAASCAGAAFSPVPAHAAPALGPQIGDPVFHSQLAPAIAAAADALPFILGHRPGMQS